MEKQLYIQANEISTRIELLNIQIDHLQEILDTDFVKQFKHCVLMSAFPTLKHQILLEPKVISLIIQELKKEIIVLEKEFEKL